MQLPSWTFDDGARLFVTAVLFAWIVAIGSDIKSAYPPVLVEAYALPLTRFLLLAFVVALTYWCPNAGVLAAMAYVFLGSDTITLTTKPVLAN
jgi:hypothetical protein